MIVEELLFSKPEEILDYIKSNELAIKMNVEEANLLLEYMEGHDYAIGTDNNKELIRKDVASVDGEVQEYSIDEVIDIVCEWNYELKLDADMRRNNPDNFIQFVNEQNRYEKLVRDEVLLDALFNQTIYCKQCKELGKGLADEFVKNTKQQEQSTTHIQQNVEKEKVNSTNNRSR